MTPHGTRSIYRAGCRCTRCRAANAAYVAAFRGARRTGRPLLHSRVSAVEAHRIVKVLRAEWVTRGALARALGRHHDLARLTHQQRITLRTLLRIRHVYRTQMLEAQTPDSLTGQDDPHGLQTEP